MHAAWVVLLLAQASADTSSTAARLETGSAAVTATATDPLLLEDLPLTEEELALLESMEPSDTASIGEQRRISLVPILVVPHRRLRARNARSLGEALREEASPFSTSRGFISGESPILRGRGGQRIRLAVDGLELRHALDSIDRSTALGLIDPWVVDRVEVSPSAPLSVGGFAGHGDLSIEARRPRWESGLTTELRGLGRLADRSSGFRAAANAALGPGALTVAGGYSDHDSMRDGTGGQQAGTGDEESSLLSRARLFDRARDPIELDLGFDLFRVTNAKRFDMADRIDRLRSLVSGFGRARTGFGDTELELMIGARRFETSTEPDGGGARTMDAADIMQADGLVTHRWSEAFALSAFAGAYASGAHGAIVRGRMLRASGGLGVELELGRFRGRAALRGGYARSEEESDKKSDGSFILPELRLGLGAWGPFTLLAGYQEAIHAPTVRDLSRARASLDLERVRTIDLGLSYETPVLDLRGSAFSSFVTNPIEFEVDAVENRPNLVLLGGEFEGLLRPVRGLELAISMSLTRGLGDERARFIEGSTGALRLRYELGVRNAYVEFAGRHALIFPGASEGQDSNRRRVWPLPFVSLGGGLDLGLGFGLNVQVANALDVDERELNLDIPRPGIDLRFALDHRFDL